MEQRVSGELTDFGLYQIELTAFCDMKCEYCPHPDMRRPKGHMSAQTLAKCIEQNKRRGMTNLVVHHFGEPLMHPELGDRLAQIAAAGMTVQFSTNGLQLEKKLPLLLETDTKFSVTLSMHQWRHQDPKYYFNALKGWQFRTEGTNVTINKAFNAFEGASEYRLHRWDKGDAATPWDYEKDCFFLRDNWGVVLWNGDLASCCVDCEGASVFGNIHDPDSTHAKTVVWHGCAGCDVIGEHYKAQNRTAP